MSSSDPLPRDEPRSTGRSWPAQLASAEPQQPAQARSHCLVLTPSPRMDGSSERPLVPPHCPAQNNRPQLWAVHNFLTLLWFLCLGPGQAGPSKCRVNSTDQGGRSNRRHRLRQLLMDHQEDALQNACLLGERQASARLSPDD